MTLEHVLFVLTGSSCAGKTTLADSLQLERLAVHDSDERGVPSDADLAWRQRELEEWVQIALDLETRGTDLLLTGQSPLGEVLAAPSAPLLDRFAVCLIDVQDRERWTRLERRDPGKWDRERKRQFVGWARWHRAHAADPTFVANALVDGGWPGMRWSRWRDWSAADPRWRTDVLDTTGRAVDECAAEVATWIERVRADPDWPLCRGWADG